MSARLLLTALGMDDELPRLPTRAELLASYEAQQRTGSTQASTSFRRAATPKAAWQGLSEPRPRGLGALAVRLQASADQAKKGTAQE